MQDGDIFLVCNRNSSEYIQQNIPKNYNGFKSVVIRDLDPFFQLPFGYFNALKRSPTVTKVFVNGNHVSDFPRLLCILSAMPQLEVIGFERLTQRQIKQLQNFTCSATEFEAKYAHLDDKTVVKLLPFFMNNLHITKISFRANYITMLDPLFPYFAVSTALKGFDLTACDFDTESAKRLLENLPLNIEWVTWTEGSREITDDLKKHIMPAALKYPKLAEIDWGGAFIESNKNADYYMKIRHTKKVNVVVTMLAGNKRARSSLSMLPWEVIRKAAELLPDDKKFLWWKREFFDEWDEENEFHYGDELSACFEEDYANQSDVDEDL